MIPSLVRSKSLYIEVLFTIKHNSFLPPKWGKKAPNGRYHAPYFSFKNAKLRLNIIIINILRAARVFIAFTFPQPCECALFQNSDAKESFLPYKSSARVLLESWRFNGVMNFRDDDADRSNYVFSVFSNAFYALYEVIEAVYCSVFLRVSRFSLCDLVCHRALKVYFVRARTLF